MKIVSVRLGGRQPKRFRRRDLLLPLLLVLLVVLLQEQQQRPRNLDFSSGCRRSSKQGHRGEERRRCTGPKGEGRPVGGRKPRVLVQVAPAAHRLRGEESAVVVLPARRLPCRPPPDPRPT